MYCFVAQGYYEESSIYNFITSGFLRDNSIQRLRGLYQRRPVGRER
jgi:hypothetical protein